MQSDLAIARAGRVQSTLRVLAALSLAIPALALLIGGYVSYSAAFTDARRQLSHVVDVSHEHALRVFDTFDLIAAQIADLTGGLDSDSVRAKTPELHERLWGIARSLPQVQDIWIIDQNGVALASAVVYPMPPGLSLADRAYFMIHQEGSRGVFVSEVLAGRAMPDARFFQLSWRRSGRDGVFAGVTAVSVQPDYFRDFYAQLTLGPQSSAALVRADGRVLARYPTPDQDLAFAAPAAAFVSAVTREPERDIFQATSPFDGVERLVAYRRLPNHPVYVTAGMATTTIRDTWLSGLMQSALIAGPASIGLFILSLVALRQSRREQLATIRLGEEAIRREQAEDALLQAQKMEAVGQLTGGVAHDFNNLLTVIVANLDRIEQSPDAAPAVKRLASAALGAAARGERLTQQLLAFARRQPLTPENADLNALLRDLAPLIRRAVGEAVEVKLDLDPKIGTVRVDRSQFEASILNLAVNARDAIGATGGRLAISTRVAERPELAPGDGSPTDQWAEIRVADTGSGIPADILQRVFEPFFTTKDVGKGAGLGLSQVYGFVKQSGGTIALDSKPGEGAVVRIWLPASPPGAAKSVPAEQPEEPRGAQLGGAGETILVVEDDPDVRAVALDTLAGRGYHVLVAADGVEALNILNHDNAVDLLFTDIVMPGGISGEELAARALARRPGLPILLTSGYTAQQQGPEAASRFPVLRKPYRAETLAREIRQALDAGDRVRRRKADATGARITVEAGAPRVDMSSAAPRVLVVEDDALVLMSTVDMLREAGFDVAGEAGDGEKALELLDRIDPPVSMLFADIGLPGMDGRMLAREASKKCPGLRVVLTTGYAPPGMDQTPDGTVTLGKPFLMRDLHRLRAQLAQRPEERAG